MTETDILLWAGQRAAYICAACTALLWIVPNPEKLKEILMIEKVHKSYIVLYNILRWLSGSGGWQPDPARAKRNGGPIKEPMDGERG